VAPSHRTGPVPKRGRLREREPGVEEWGTLLRNRPDAVPLALTCVSWVPWGTDPERDLRGG